MRKFLKYLAAFVAVVLVVGIFAGSVIKTLIFGIFSENAQPIYSITRVALQLIVFVILCLWINQKDSSKYDSLSALDFPAISKSPEKKKAAIISNKHFRGEIISFSCFLFAFWLFIIPTTLRHSGILLVVLEFIITAIMIIIYTIINYKMTFKTLEQIRLTRHRYE